MENRTESRMDMVPFVFNDNMVRGCLDDRGEPWFVARDVAAVLDLQNIRQNLDSLDEDEKGVCIAYTHGGEQRMLTISESGLYALIFRSRKPEAKRFRKWVTAEVLPALRKRGYYARPGSTFGISEGFGHLRPRMKREALALAVRMAALDNGGSDEAVRWFGEISAMLGSDAGNVTAYNNQATVEEARDFAAACLEAEPGHLEKAGRVYAAYRRWRGTRQGLPLSQSALGRALGSLYRKRKFGDVEYLDVRLREEWR